MRLLIHNSIPVHQFVCVENFIIKKKKSHAKYLWCKIYIDETSLYEEILAKRWLFFYALKKFAKKWKNKFLKLSMGQVPKLSMKFFSLKNRTTIM